MSKEAKLERDEHGVGPVTEGWFVTNLDECRWVSSGKFGRAAIFENPEQRFAELGLHVHVLEPGQPACHYHRENCQEDFLVLFGECKVIVEDEERALRAWDLVHCPPDVDHVFVGAGDGPCAILMMGDRKGPDTKYFYPVNDKAARHDGCSKVDTDDPKLSYAGERPPKPIPSPWKELLAGR